jgi:hypothetical protein
MAQTKPETPAVVPPGQSRRHFLRNAVIGSAAAAGVGVAGFAAAHTPAAKPIIRLLHTSGIGTASAVSTGTACFEDTGFNQYGSAAFDTKDNDGDIEVDNSNHNAIPGSFFLWFTVHDVAPDNYTITVDSPTLGDTSTPFEYSNSGNNAFLYNMAKNTAADCPTSKPDSSQIGQSHSVPGLFPSSGVSIPQGSLSGNTDLQLLVHIDWHDANSILSSLSTTFNITLHRGGSGGAVVSTASVTVVADNEKLKS